MYLVARVYESEHQARGAYDALLDAGLSTAAIVIAATTRPGEEPGSRLSDDEASTVRAGGLLQKHAGFYADELRKGKHIVAVRAPFGRTVEAKAIVDDFNPLPQNHEPPSTPYVAWTERPAAFSASIGMPVLMKTGTPFSSFWGMSTGKGGLSILSRIFKPLTDGFMFSNMIGMGFQTAGATPLSSMVGMSGKSGRLEGKTSSFGLPLKTKGGTPLSSTFGLKLLTRRKRILSS